MNQLKLYLSVTFFLIFLLIFAGNGVYSQDEMPEVLNTGTVREQFDYLEERTRIYNDYRAIREDMFQQIKSNTMDSILILKNTVIQLEDQVRVQELKIDSLLTVLQSTNTKLDQAVRNRDRLTFLWIPMHKALYNTVVWIIIAGLTFLSVVLFLSARRITVISKNNKKDLEEIKEEFEAYRKSSRERYEKLAVQLNNEIRKLKGR